MERDIEKFYEGLMAARIKGTFMLQVLKEGRKEGRKEIVIELRRIYSS